MAVTYDFGKCSACGESNSKSIQFCRSCGVPLPWAKQQKVKVDGVATKMGLGDIAVGAISLWIAGGLFVMGGVYLWLGHRIGFAPNIGGLGQLGIFLGGIMCRFAATMDS